MRLTRRSIILGAAGAASVLALAVGCGAAGTSGSSPPAQKPSSSAAGSTPTPLSVSELAFISQMRTNYNFGSGVSDRDIAHFGHQVCTLREGGDTQATAAQVAASSWTNTSTTEGEAMARLAEKDLCPSELPVQRWHVIASYNGSGTWNSPQFRLHDSPVRVTFSYSGNGSSEYGGDNFMADLVSSSDDLMIANDIAISGGKTTTLYPDMSYGGSPNYHLEVEATGSWSFTISQKY
jgi:hypothetical protein